MEEELREREGETVDEVLGGRLWIIQKKNAYRFSLDALLLAHFVLLKEGDDLIDLGTGSGIIALILAGRYRCGKVLGIDLQEEHVAMARRSVSLNNLEGRVAILRGDVCQPGSFSAPLSFDVVVFNPPYRRLRSGRVNSDPAKAMARHEIAGTAADFLAAADYLLRDGGRVYTIYPATRMVELIFRMRASGLEPKRLRMVHSRRGGAATFVLVEGQKGGGEELAVLPPLFIYETAGVYTGEAAAIFRDLSVFPSPGAG